VSRRSAITHGMRTVFLISILLSTSVRASAQEIFGQVLDGSNGQPVQTAGVFLLDVERSQIAVAIADSLGRYALSAPAGGEYYLFVQRLGYFETESPLVEVGGEGRYAIDLEIQPEPISLDPLLVSVRNDQLLRWMTRRFGRNPAADYGFRVIQGLRLEEARLRSDDNTDLFRWLYLDIWNGVEACTGPRGSKAERGSMRLIAAPCGKVIVDDVPYPAEYLDGFDMDEISVLITIGADVMIFTRGFDWSVLPAPGR
jgi:Carboxypeptidase regulatory-like domain